MGVCAQGKIGFVPCTARRALREVPLRGLRIKFILRESAGRSGALPLRFAHQIYFAKNLQAVEDARPLRIAGEIYIAQISRAGTETRPYGVC